MFTELSKKNSKKEVQEIVKTYLPKFKAINKINADSVIIGTIDLEFWMEEKMK